MSDNYDDGIVLPLFGPKWIEDQYCNLDPEFERANDLKPIDTNVVQLSPGQSRSILELLDDIDALLNDPVLKFRAAKVLRAAVSEIAGDEVLRLKAEISKKVPSHK